MCEWLVETAIHVLLISKEVCCCISCWFFSVSNPMFQKKMRMMRRWQKMTRSSPLLQLSTYQTKRSEVNTTLHYFSYQCHKQKRSEVNTISLTLWTHYTWMKSVFMKTFENLRPVWPVVLIPKKITGPYQGPIVGLIAVKRSTCTYGSPWYITTTYNWKLIQKQSKTINNICVL